MQCRQSLPMSFLNAFRFTDECGFDLRVNVRLRVLVAAVVWYRRGTGSARYRDWMGLCHLRRRQSWRRLLGDRLRRGWFDPAAVRRRSTPIFIVGEGVREISNTEYNRDFSSRIRFPCLLLFL